MGIFDIFSNSSAEDAAAARTAGLNAGYSQASDLLGQGRDALNTNYGNASNLYAGLLNSSTAGANAYGDASGANGATGLQNATNNFKSSQQYGNYGFALDQGLQALQRTHAAAGNLNSGNADSDTLKYATGLAGQQYTNYLAGLSPYLGQQTSAVSGAAGVDTGLGNALNTSYGAQGALANTTQTGIGNANAAADLNNYNVSGNIVNAALQGGKLASNLFGAFA